jgi:hypothetical protein
MGHQQSLQQVLFQQIRSKIPENLSFVHEIAELLEISYDSAYRRIRGEKELSLEELYRLSQRFDVSMDALLGLKADNVVFHKYVLVHGKITIKNWLATIVDEIRKIQAAKDKNIIYAAKDPPIFHYFNFPELAAFKLFFWEKTLLDFPEHEDKQFRLDESDHDVIETGKNILRMASKIPSVEIWNEDTFQILLRQIEYHWISGYFHSKDDITNLMDKLEQWLKHIQKQAEVGFRFSPDQQVEGVPNSFMMYENEVVLNDDTIFVRMDDKISTYLTFNVIGLLITHDPVFCSSVEQYMKGLMKKSNLISLSGEKARNRFFNKMFITIEKARMRLEI